ncbi:MAG: uracil-DNA glycosylase [Cryomorphaceae bacterium]|nr:uracil-DNA glycosylase [Cryomorphaceae bacterium]
MVVRIESSWKYMLADEFEAPYFKRLTDFVKQEYSATRCFPPASLIFNAFDICAIDHVKVVILGQDPYIRPGQAQGLSFSVPRGVPFPPSLENILKEAQEDIGTRKPESGDLTRWAEQGVLLLNSTLTVREGESASHAGKGWERFTDAAIQAVSLHKDHVVFILWGSFAQKKEALIDASKHLILKAPHPSPLSSYRGFFGSKPFSKTNRWLNEHNMESIIW